jgi:hypothetical protein
MPAPRSLAQSGRRTTRLGTEPFLIDTAAHRRQWRTILLAIEQQLVADGSAAKVLRNGRGPLSDADEDLAVVEDVVDGDGNRNGLSGV